MERFFMPALPALAGLAREPVEVTIPEAVQLAEGAGFRLGEKW
jgi:hypothetical protein